MSGKATRKRRSFIGIDVSNGYLKSGYTKAIITLVALMIRKSLLP